MKLRWISREVCLAVHDMLLSQYGGCAGLRDSGLLDSAIARPLQMQAYGSPTTAELAAAYATGIIRNHPFLDGNKRTGFMLGSGFLELNGMEFFATEADAVIKTLALAAGELTEQAYAEWLAKNSRAKAGG
ncbi:MAG: type II toxin-antitoxin system death-on-curing family toxin [Chthoniobacterales bacterium]